MAGHVRRDCTVGVKHCPRQEHGKFDSGFLRGLGHVHLHAIGDGLRSRVGINDMAKGGDAVGDLFWLAEYGGEGFLRVYVLVTEATKRGLRPTAIPDITARARITFKLVDGVPQAFDGQTARMGKDGPMTLAEWVDALVSDAPHLFEANAGGGAAGSGSGGAGNRSVKNPFRKETWNLTEQMKLQKSDPQLAARLKASA